MVATVMECRLDIPLQHLACFRAMVIAISWTIHRESLVRNLFITIYGLYGRREMRGALLKSNAMLSRFRI